MKKIAMGPVGVYIVIMLLAVNSAAAQNEKVLLETIGVLSAQGIYLTYTAIGTLADSYDKDVYDTDFTIQVLEEYLSITSAAKEQLNNLLSTGAITGNDITYLNKLIVTYDLLTAEANALKNFVRTGDTKHADVFHENREAAWDNITELLGLDE